MKIYSVNKPTKLAEIVMQPLRLVPNTTLILLIRIRPQTDFCSSENQIVSTLGSLLCHEIVGFTVLSNWIKIKQVLFASDPKS